MNDSKNADIITEHWILCYHLQDLLMSWCFTQGN